MSITRRTIIIGSRGSELALWQARFVAGALQNLGYASEIRVIKTQGDKIQHLSLEKLEGKGFFTKEIEDALLSGTVDIAVHSHKDLPTAQTPGLVIAAVSAREDPSELLLIRKESCDMTEPLQLRRHATVGTSSSRRTVQMSMLRSDILFKDIRGNVPTRVQKLRNGDYDAIILAYAGIHRLGLDVRDLHVVHLKPTQFVPAPAQGVLAFQCRESDAEMISILQQLNDAHVAGEIYVERTVMQLFNGGCHMPLGVFCKKADRVYHAWAAQAGDRTGTVKRMYMAGNDPVRLAQDLFLRLKKDDTRRVLITAEPDQAEFAARILRNNGFDTVLQSFLKFSPIDFSLHTDDIDWLFFTSKKGVQYFFDRMPNIPSGIQIAAIGPETAQMVVRYGYSVTFTGTGDAVDTASAFEPYASGQRVVFAGAQHARKELRNAVREYARVEEIPVYANEIAGAPAADADIIGFTSPMQVDGYRAINHIPADKLIIAIGTTTAQHLSALGCTHVHVPPTPSIAAMAEYISGML